MLHMNPALHELVPDGQWVAAMREVTGVNLFVYYHRSTRNFVVCEWITRTPVYGQGLSTCEELFTLSAPPDHHPHDLPSKAWVINRCRRGEEVLQEVRDKRRAARRDHAEIRQESEEERLDTANYLRRKGMDAAAFTLTAGCAPFVGQREGGAELEDIKRTLTDSKKNRVTTYGKKKETNRA